MTTSARLALTHIVPTIPPAIDGLGDYADILSRQLLARHGVPSRFLIIDQKWTGTRGEVECLQELTATALLDHLTRLPRPAATAHQVVILHFVSYAYDGRRGLPEWLIAGLEYWIAASPQHHLITVFHELYATSWPFRKAFWYSAFQRRMCGRLCRASTVAVTSRDAYARWINRYRPAHASRCQVWPVLSNVGEPATVLPVDARQPWLVVFGQAPTRSRTYRLNRHRLAALCERFQIREVHDIGAPIPDCPLRVGTVPVLAHGRLSREDITQLLAQARFGLIDYNRAHLAKSGVFAAYCSHGLVPLTETTYPSEDGLVAGETMIGLDQVPDDLQRLSTAAFTWYQGHASPALADAMAANLRALVPEAP